MKNVALNRFERYVEKEAIKRAMDSREWLVYVETDFLKALVKDEGRLHEGALHVREDRGDTHTSRLPYAEVRVHFYDGELGEFDVDAPRDIANLERSLVREVRHDPEHLRLNQE